MDQGEGGADAMPNVEIAAAMERAVSSQSELITSLSLLVIGGLLTLMLQYEMHKWFIVMLASVVCMAASIALGYMISGNIIQVAPQLYGHQFTLDVRFWDQEFHNNKVSQIETLSLWQFVTFFSGVVIGALFVVKNRST